MEALALAIVVSLLETGLEFVGRLADFIAWPDISNFPGHITHIVIDRLVVCQGKTEWL
jgi:hypothetical protein